MSQTLPQKVRRTPQRRRKRRDAWGIRRRALLAAVWGEETVAAPACEAERRPLWQHGAILAGYALLAVLTTWPMITRFGTHVPSDGGDALQNYWNAWWLRRALADGLNPYQTDLLYAPYGAPLYLHTLAPLNGLLSLPFQVFGLTVAYNALVLLLLILAAYCAFLLVAHVSRHTVAGAIGGVVYAFGSYHMTHLLGHASLLASWAIPLAILCFLRATETGGRRRTRFVAATVGCLLCLVLSDWQYVIFAALAIGCLAAWFALTRRSPVPVLVATISVGLCVLLALPLILATIGEIRSGLVTPPDPGAARVYSADVLSFVLPAERHTWWGAWAKTARTRLPAPPVEGDIFLGFLPLALGLWALVRDPRRAAPWALVGLGFAILALGPILHWRGDWRWDGPNGTLRTIPMPYALVQQLPGLNFIRAPIRLSLIVTLALAVLVGLAIAQIARRWPALRRPRLAVPVVGLLVALLVGEHLAIPFPLENTAVPAFYRELARSDEQGVILEWPLSFKRSRSHLYQTVHGRPIMGGYVSRRLAYPVRALPPFRGLPGRGSDIYIQPAGAEQMAPWALQWSGVRWVVFYRNDPGFNEQDVAAFARNYADGGPIYQDAEMIVFRPRPPVAPAAMIVGGEGWYESERIGEAQTLFRWFESAAQFDIWRFGEDEGTYALRFDAWSFHQPRRLEVWLDGQRLGEWRVTETQRFDLPITLASGPHRVELRALDPAISPASVGYSEEDTRPLAFAISNVRLER